MGTPLFAFYSRRTLMTMMARMAKRTSIPLMTSIPALLLLVVQEPFVNSMPTECCAAKTVGDYSYTQVDSPDSFPAECKESCAYTRDGQEGSIYCFAPGNLAVHCKGEKPIDLLMPVYGPFGNLPGQAEKFNDSDIAGGQNITGLNMWTKLIRTIIVVSGIQMIYGGLEGTAHGDTTGKKIECKNLPNQENNKLQYTKITIRSVEKGTGPGASQNQIYSLLFEVEGEDTYRCQAGDPIVGEMTVIPVGDGKGGKHPAYIFGKELTEGNKPLQSLNFVFKNK